MYHNITFQSLPKYTEIGIFGTQIHIPSGSPDYFAAAHARSLSSFRRRKKKKVKLNS
jgi:hypothetical protein